VPSFNQADIGASFEAHISRGSKQSVSVEAESSILPHIKTKVERDCLIVTVEGSVSTHKPMIVRITTPNLKALHLSGSAQAQVQGLHERDFNLELSGSSTCDFKGTAGALVLDFSGSSVGKLDGFGRASVKADLSGSSAAHLGGTATSLTVGASGSSTFELSHVDASKVEASADGASSVKLGGMTGYLKGTAEGSGSLELGQLMADSADIVAEGAAHVRIGVKKELRAQAGGASEIAYSGSPHTVSSTASGASTVHKG
jgi:hypothetical protein